MTPFSALLVLFAAAGSGNALAEFAAGAEWTTAGGTPQGTRYSSLDQITPGNIAKLVKDFSAKTEVKGRFMGEPLVIGSTLYAVTPYPNKLIAYDLGQRGKIKWTYAPSINEYAKGANCCGGINRGAAYADGKIVLNLLDNTVVAVNAVTGKQIWRTNLADPHTGVTMTIAPIITPGKSDGVKKVITASSSGEMGVRGWIQALDLNTGKPLWRAYNTGPDKDVLIDQNFHAFYPKDQGSDAGAKSWPNQRSWLLGGSSAWAYLTYDPDLDLLFYGTSQPGVWNADMRPGDNKWGASVFARKPDTGSAVWAYQFVPNDSWDFDAASENIPVDQPVNGVPRKLLVHLNKNGFAYTFDRTSGEILVANQFGAEVNWASHIDLTTGKPVVDETRRVHQGVLTEHVCPSVLGAKGWEPGSFSPKTGLFYMPTFNLCGNLEALKAEFISGAPYMGSDYAIKPATDNTYTSELIAWDATKGVKKWGVKEPGMIYAGTLATAGGVIFYSTQTPAALKAVDATTGQSLWSASLKCNTVGNPISFAGPDGKQRIAVFSDNTCTGGSGSGQVNVFKPGL